MRDLDFYERKKALFISRCKRISERFQGAHLCKLGLVAFLRYILSVALRHLSLRSL